MPPESPAFDLRFARGRGALVLAHPMRPIASPFAWGEVSRLELALGALPSPVDLRQGAGRFRHRQATLIRAVVRVDLDALALALGQGAFKFQALGSSSRNAANLPSDGDEVALYATISDGARTAAMDVALRFVGADLLLAPSRVHSGRLGAGPAWALAMRAMREAGARFDSEHGAMKVIDPIGVALAEALIPHGYRLPDGRAAFRRASLHGRSLILEATRRAEGDGAHSAGAFQVARALCAVTAAVLDDDQSAEAEASRVASRVGPEAARELALMRSEWGGAAPTSDGSTEVACARLHAAVLASDAPAAALEARLIARLEQSGDLAAEALEEAASVAEDEDPATAADLLAAAIARAPGNVARAQHWLEAAARAPDASRLKARAAEIARELGGGRPEILSAAASALRAAGDLDGARALLERARGLSREDAPLDRALAELDEERGDLESALAHMDSAATSYGADELADDEAAARFDAARLAEALGQIQGAISRLERASGRARGALRARALAELARLQRAEGIEAAIETELALVREVPSTTEGPASDALRSALTRAAEHAVQERAGVRGRAILDALERLGVPARQVASMRETLDAADLEGIETGEGTNEERAERARKIAERLRASGRMADAARALAQAGALDGDAATLRAAVELAERAGETDAALEVLDIALRVVGEGPARASLLQRRAKLTGTEA